MRGREMLALVSRELTDTVPGSRKQDGGGHGDERQPPGAPPRGPASAPRAPPSVAGGPVSPARVWRDSLQDCRP